MARRRRPAPRLCRRKGCSTPRRHHPFCDPCWGKVSPSTRRAIAAAHAMADPTAIATAWVRASEDVKAALPREAARRTYARIAAQLGEHDEAEEVRNV